MNFSHGMVTSLGDAWASPAAAGWDAMERGPHSPHPPPCLHPREPLTAPRRTRVSSNLKAAPILRRTLGGFSPAFRGYSRGSVPVSS